MKEKQQLYEGMYILSPVLSEDARSRGIERITQGITSRGGEIKKIHDLGRKKLAFEVRGTKEGNYFLIYFFAPKNILKELWEEYHLNEDLLRFMNLKASEVKEELEFRTLDV